MARRNTPRGAGSDGSDGDVVDVDATVATTQTGAESAAAAPLYGAEAWNAWPAIVAQASEAWWRLQADAWQQQLAWWNGLVQGRLPLLQAFDIAEAEAEHAANPVAASPIWLPAQEAGRHVATMAVANWNNWLGWSGNVSRWFEAPDAR